MKLTRVWLRWNPGYSDVFRDYWLVQDHLRIHDLMRWSRQLQDPPFL